MRKNTCLSFLILVSLIIWQPAAAFGQQDISLQAAIQQYQQENYEEAIEILQKVRQQDKTSSTAAFFLGLAYKQTNDIQQALPQFLDAVTLTPRIREAVTEIVDIYVQTDRLAEAQKWLDVAEKEKIDPPKTFFLKGMVLAKQRKYAEAIPAFEKAKQLEKSYTQAADFQIAICYMADRKFSKARERFQAAVTQDPLSDLASFARRYQDIVEEQSFLQRPVRVAFSSMAQYDTNMLVEPMTRQGLPDSGREKSFAMTNSLRIDYVPILPGRMLFNAGYGAVSRVNEENATTYDMFAQTFNMSPGIDFGRFAVNAVGQYTYALKRGDANNIGGGYRPYMENFFVGPMIRYLAAQNHILEMSGGYAKKNFFKPAPIGNLAEDMSASGLDSYLSWMWLFQNGGLIITRMGYNIDNGDGTNWSAAGYKLSVNMIYPLIKKLSLQTGAEYNAVMYKYPNQSFGGMIRGDHIYTGTAGLTYAYSKHINFITQIQLTAARSNLFLYDYNRTIYSAGIELRF